MEILVGLGWTAVRWVSNVWSAVLWWHLICHSALGHLLTGGLLLFLGDLAINVATAAAPHVIPGGRAIAKFVSPAYLTRKGGTEYA